MLSEKALQDFKKIYRAEFNAEISDEEALALGTNLLTIFNNIYRPLKKEWVQDKDKYHASPRRKQP